VLGISTSGGLKVLSLQCAEPTNFLFFNVFLRVVKGKIFTPPQTVFSGRETTPSQSSTRYSTKDREDFLLNYMFFLCNIVDAAAQRVIL